jgi:hypothetical protein
MISPQDVECIRECGSIRHRGSRADHVEIVANHVRQHQRYDGGRRCQPCELTTLDSRQMLTNGIQLVNVRAARQQRFRRGLLIGERNPSAGSGSKAEAPPDIRQITRSRCPALRAISTMPFAPRMPFLSGTGCPHSHNSTRRSRAVCPYFTFTRPSVMRRPGTRSIAAAIVAPAFPAPTTYTFSNRRGLHRRMCRRIASRGSAASTAAWKMRSAWAAQLAFGGH